MADLSSSKRNRLDDSSFAIPSQRKYPIPDKAHAANALARVSQHGTQAERDEVRKRVCARFPDLPYCQSRDKSGDSRVKD